MGLYVLWVAEIDKHVGCIWKEYANMISQRNAQSSDNRRRIIT